MEELLIQNEWWETGEVSKEKAKAYRRKVLREVKEIFFNYKQILILTGLRRVGKTTIIYQLIEDLLKEGTDPRHILYFSFDKAIKEPLEIFETYEKITKINWKKEKIYVFFDEIQKLAEWTSKIKLLYDSLPNIKFCLSGSASLMIERKAIEDLAGRYFKVEIKFLTLQEFAELYYGTAIDDFELHRSKLEAIFEDYVRRPFPELVKWQEKEKVNSYLKELVLERIVKVDIPDVFKGVNTELLSRLTELFVRNIGSILNTEALSKDLHVHKLTLVDHIYYLIFSKLIRIVKNYRPSLRAESRKLPKVYLEHPCFAFSYYLEPEIGKVAENLVSSALELDKYFRSAGKEVDFLKLNGELLPIEVKANDNLSKDELKPLLWFLDKYKLNKGLIIYTGEENEKTFNSKKILFIPLQKVLFNFKL
jgi:predicted AAA+ superfamily ATPase